MSLAALALKMRGFENPQGEAIQHLMGPGQKQPKTTSSPPQLEQIYERLVDHQQRTQKFNTGINLLLSYTGSNARIPVNEGGLDPNSFLSSALQMRQQQEQMRQQAAQAAQQRAAEEARARAAAEDRRAAFSALEGGGLEAYRAALAAGQLSGDNLKDVLALNKAMTASGPPDKLNLVSFIDPKTGQNVTVPAGTPEGIAQARALAGSGWVQGSPVEVRAGDVAPKTEADKKAFLQSAMQGSAGRVINEMEATYDPSNIRDAAARAVPVGENFFKSSQGQKYQAAAAVWAEQALRAMTGAAATQEEIERIVKNYFAQPGDTPDTIAFKRQLRNDFTTALGGQLPPDIAVPEGSVQVPESFAGGGDESGLDSILRAGSSLVAPQEATAPTLPRVDQITSLEDVTAANLAIAELIEKPVEEWGIPPEELEALVSEIAARGKELVNNQPQASGAAGRRERRRR